jgi:hypothetical protein
MFGGTLLRGLQTQPTSPTAHHHIWTPARRSYSGISSPVTSTPTRSYFGTVSSRRSQSPPWRPQSAPGARQLSAPVAPAAPDIETEEEYVEFYQQRILTAQQRQLLPLQEDLADWLNKLLGKSKTISSIYFSATIGDLKSQFLSIMAIFCYFLLI